MPAREIKLYNGVKAYVSFDLDGSDWDNLLVEVGGVDVTPLIDNETTGQELVDEVLKWAAVD
jgi:hypothetical protein